jgi:hypothetical protein
MREDESGEGDVAAAAANIHAMYNPARTDRLSKCITPHLHYPTFLYIWTGPFTAI